MSDPTSPSRARRRGFTLIEVLAALLLVAIVLPVVMRGVSVGTTSAAHSKRRTEAASLAQSKLSELIATRDWENGLLSGRFDTYNGDNADAYAWRADLRPWSRQYVKELTLYVTWGKETPDQTVTLSTLVYEGKPKDPEDEQQGTDDADTGTGAAGGGAS